MAETNTFPEHVYSNQNCGSNQEQLDELKKGPNEIVSETNRFREAGCLENGCMNQEKNNDSNFISLPNRRCVCKSVLSINERFFSG